MVCWIQTMSILLTEQSKWNCVSAYVMFCKVTANSIIPVRVISIRFRRTPMSTERYVYWTTKLTHHFSKAFNIALPFNFCIHKVTDPITFKFMLPRYHEWRSGLPFSRLNYSYFFQFCYAIKLPVYKLEVNKLLRIFWLQNEMFWSKGDTDLH